MGCLAAQMFHFIVSDMNDDGFNDLGIIKEELLCKEYFDSINLVDGVMGPMYMQQPVKWYIFQNNCWEGTEKFTGVFRDYIELPLIDLSLSPVDFFGFIHWHSYDPKDWNNPGTVKFYPDYRKKLITEM